MLFNMRLECIFIGVGVIGAYMTCYIARISVMQFQMILGMKQRKMNDC